MAESGLLYRPGKAEKVHAFREFESRSVLQKQKEKQMFGLYRFDDMGDWEKETLLTCCPDGHLLEKEIDRLVGEHKLLLEMNAEVWAAASTLPLLPISATNMHVADMAAARTIVRARHPDIDVDWEMTGTWLSDLSEDDFEIRELPMLEGTNDK